MPGFCIGKPIDGTAGARGASSLLNLAYWGGMQLSVCRAVLPDHTFPLALAIPPPPSETVTLQ
jgi:hypothetical protein